MSIALKESAVAPTKVGGNWRAVLITPGKGSTGFYGESMLRESGPTAFPKGTHSYIDHPTAEAQQRSPKNLMGVLAEDAHYEDGVGLVAELKVMDHWKAFVEEVAPHTGLSIYAMGDGTPDESGQLIVESLTPHPQNSVDLVSYPGRPGSGMAEQLYESALAAFDSSKGDAAAAETVTPMEEKGIITMDEELKAALAELPALIAAAVVEAMKAEEETPDVEETADVTAVAEAMVAADLPEVSRKAVYESLRSGVKIVDAIEAQKAFVESIKLSLKESAVAPVAAVVVREETLVVNDTVKAESLAGILNVKVGR